MHFVKHGSPRLSDRENNYEKRTARGKWMNFNFKWRGGVIKKITVKDLKVNELAIWVSGGNIPESGTGQCKSPKPGVCLESRENRKEASVTKIG